MRFNNNKFIFSALYLVSLLLSVCNNASATTTTHSIGGTVYGLAGTVVLQNNGGDNLSVSANGTFTFATRIAIGDTYNVAVLTQPAGQTCTVRRGSGTVLWSNWNGITNLEVRCAYNNIINNIISVGGTVYGLVGTVVLQNNGGDNRSVSANSAFTFATKIAVGNTYNVTVLT